MGEKNSNLENWFKKFQSENGWEKFGVMGDKILNRKIGEKQQKSA